MISTSDYPADETELSISNAFTARKWLSEHAENDLALIESLCAHADASDAVQNTAIIAHARMGLRNSGWQNGARLAYHNTGHNRDLLQRLQRMDRLEPLKKADYQLLLLFSVSHDLRQRESASTNSPVGANEQATIAEVKRINLITQGLDRESLALLSWMIAGSTFAVPEPSSNSTGGALAGALRASWANQAELSRRSLLTGLAADLDTANVAAPLPEYVRHAVALCEEMQTRNRQTLDADALPAVFAFITEAQLHFFFTLHQFYTEQGQQTFADDKTKTGELLEQLVAKMRQLDLAEFSSAEDLLVHYQNMAQTLTTPST